MPRLAGAEAVVQGLIESNMEAMLGVRLLVSEYSTGPVHGGRIDSLGIDENGAPVIVEYKRATDAGVINQGLYYLSWLMDHRAEFGHLVRDRLGARAASQILWSSPRLICIAGDFTRYDVHAVREQRRSIDLVRYRYFGEDHIGLETVASAKGHGGVRRMGALSPARPDGPMSGLAAALDEALRGLGHDVTAVQRKQYRAYQRLRNFACVCTPRKAKILVYLKLDPGQVDPVPGFVRDVRRIGHHGTGGLEVTLRTGRDVDRAQDLFLRGYAAA
jgi:predicted transport protein